MKTVLNIYAKSKLNLFLEGESNQDALARVLNFLMELEERYSEKTILLSSHGNLIGILLHHFDPVLIMKNGSR